MTYKTKGSICMYVMLVFVFVIHPAANSQDIRIHDDVLTEANKIELSNFVSHILTWQRRSLFGKEDAELAAEKSFWHSSSHQDVLFSKTNAWQTIHELVMSHLNYNEETNGDKLWPVDVEGRVLLRGDLPRVQKLNNSSVLTVFVFIYEKCEKNMYGEMMFFGKNGDYQESVHPKNGRVVLVPATVDYMAKPPSMNTGQSLLVISLGVTSNAAALLVSKPPPDYNDIRFPISPRETSWEISKHNTKEFQTADKKKIAVFDDVFTQDERNRFLEKIENGVYNYNPPSKDSDDNVMWILGLDVANLLASDLWPIVKKALVATTGSDSYHPYDVSCNNIQTWHHPKLHRDCSDSEDDHTLIVYLTPNWTESHYGETVFYEDGEIIAVVRPRFGRLVVFHGAIWHSARPPSPGFNGPRYTFALKCAPSKELAMRKSLILSFESLFSLDIELVGPEKAAEINHFVKMLKDGEGEHKEMEKLAMKYESELDELEKQQAKGMP